MTDERRVVAVIPARGGSKGVIGKNLRRVGGRSLVARSIEVARRVETVDEIVVTTDSADIAAAAQAAGGRVVWRPAALASDDASSESAVLHAIDELGLASDDIVAFLQCTSPFIDPDRLADAIDRVTSRACEVTFAVVSSHGFLWRQDPSGRAIGVNHDPAVRLRRQDREAEFLETGAFYVFGVEGFRAHRHRFFGRVEAVEVPALHAIEIDDEHDLVLANSLAATADALPRASLAGALALVTDFDGVHTDNRAVVRQDGIESAAVHRGDGMGISMGRRAGIPMLILSTEVNSVVARRAEKLQIECESGHDDKLTVLKEWADRNAIDPAAIAYVGNDVNDLGCLEWVGHPIVVADAHPGVANRGYITTSLPGGSGAVREVIDWMLADRPPDDRTRRNDRVND